MPVLTATPDMFVKRSDQGRTIQLVLEEQTDPGTWADPDVPEWEPIDLTGKAARIVMRAPSVALVTGVATVVTPLAGRVDYTWDEDDLNYAGSYELEVELTSAGPVIETVPNEKNRNLLVNVDPDLDAL